MTAKNVCCWDLEGPISVLDFAAELGRLLSKNSNIGLQKYNTGAFYKMLSEYDDYLIDVPGVKEKLNIPDYQPGDTLRLIAPLYVSTYSDEDLIKLAKQNLGLLPGCIELMDQLRNQWEIYIISTSYSHFAYNVANALSIPKEHVFCTELNVKKAKKTFDNIKSEVKLLVNSIFQHFMSNGNNLDAVVEELNNFFWDNEESDYLRVMNLIKVRGGKRKELALETISREIKTPISQFIVIGDSITDIDMLQRVKDEEGIAVSFNGNRFSVSRANIAITSLNNLGTLPIFENRDNLETFLESWESTSENFKNNPLKIPNNLISENTKNYFVKYRFVPAIENLTNKTQAELDLIIKKQERMRKKARGWSGNLG
ncbi:MAG: HAD hydrolase family protein [Candidatus Hermodarchaeota archaeon]